MKNRKNFGNDIYLYNTASKKLEQFVPQNIDQVTIYVCGPTVYGRVHLGNCRSAIVFDILYRFLKIFFHVKYIRNITDIDDKIIAKSIEKKTSFNDIASKYAQFYEDDMKQLNLLNPTDTPKATECIVQIQNMIKSLIEKNFAYVVEGHVFFDISKFDAYGDLSNRKIEDMLSGVRVEINEEKKHPADFVLWKPSKNKEIGWDSPWGKGRPGWHIECSAMIYHYLGDSFDIHGGGCDLIFPHHENEIAQSKALFGENSFANFWLHNGMLTVDGKKMSKSQNNFITVVDALEKYRPEIIRYVLLLSHYRQDCDFSNAAAIQVEKSLNKIYKIYEEVEKSKENIENADFVDGFLQSLCKDLNVSKAFSSLHKAIKKFISSKDIILGASIIKSADLLGLVNVKYEDKNYFHWYGWNKQKNNTYKTSEIEDLISKRNIARKNKDFKTADSIREELNKMGITIKDNKKTNNVSKDEK